jgi:hypothetical protein
LVINYRKDERDRNKNNNKKKRRKKKGRRKAEILF